MISFDEAVAIFAAHARPLRIETLPVGEAADRVLATDVVAAIDSPRRDVSAMDGYAVRSADLADLPARLTLVGESFAGQADLPKVTPGTCARIFTGGAVPAGADRVVVQEVVRRDGDDAIFDSPPGPSRHIRNHASDFAIGDRLVAAGTVLGPRAIVAAAAADIGEITLWARPRLIVLSTGDELASPGEARSTAGSIPDSVALGVAALGRQWGGDLLRGERISDDQALLEFAAARALDDADLIVVTGGASFGERDFAKSMFGPSGLELLFSKVSIKPGKPVWFGRAGEKLILGLPGNPTSAMVTARLFLAPLISGLCGRAPLSALSWQSARLSTSLPAGSDRETFVRARWSQGDAMPLDNQDSGAQRTLATADLLIRRPSGCPLSEPGTAVSVLPF